MSHARLPAGIKPRPAAEDAAGRGGVLMSVRIDLLTHVFNKLVELRRSQIALQPTDWQLAELAETLESSAHERSDSTT